MGAVVYLGGDAREQKCEGGESEREGRVTDKSALVSPWGSVLLGLPLGLCRRPLRIVPLEAGETGAFIYLLSSQLVEGALGEVPGRKQQKAKLW